MGLSRNSAYIDYKFKGDTIKGAYYAGIQTRFGEVTKEEGEECWQKAIGHVHDNPPLQKVRVAVRL